MRTTISSSSPRAHERGHLTRYFPIVAILALLLAACGGGEEAAPDPDAGGDTGTPTSTEAAAPAGTETNGDTAAAACDASDGGEPVALTYPVLAGGGLGSVPGWYITDSGTAEEYGFDITLRDFDSPQSFYGAHATGEIEVAYGTPDGLAAQAAAGAPIRIISTLSDMSGVIVANEDFEWTDPTSLEGHRFAALEASGTYLTMKNFIEENYDISFEEDVEVVTANSLPGGPTQVAAGTADAAMSWEPAATVAVLSNPGLEIVYQLGPDYEEKVGETLWHFVLTAREDSSLSDDQLDCFVEMMAEATNFLMENPAEADRIAVENGLIEGAYLQALESDRLNYIVEEPTDQIVGEMQRALARSGAEEGLGGEIPDEFWGN